MDVAGQRSARSPLGRKEEKRENDPDGDEDQHSGKNRAEKVNELEDEERSGEGYKDQDGKIEELEKENARLKKDRENEKEQIS